MSHEDWRRFQALPLYAQAEVMNAVFQTRYVDLRDWAHCDTAKLFRYIESKPHIEERFLKALAAILRERGKGEDLEAR